MSSNNNILTQEIKPPEKPKEFIFHPTGYKKHLLIDNAVVMITDDPDKNNIDYTFNYFILKGIWKSFLSPERYDRAITKLHGREEVFIDYDKKLVGLRGRSPTVDGKKVVVDVMNRRIRESFTGDELQTFTDESGKVTMLGDTVILSGD